MKKKSYLVEDSYMAGMLTMIGMRSLTEDLYYGSAEAFCENAAERWVDPWPWGIPFGILFFVGGLMLMHRANVRESRK